MPTALLVLIAFAAAAALDLVAIAWHDARERRSRWRGAALAMVHEALTWAPLVLALQVGGAPAMAGASVLGVGLASAVGLRARRSQ